MESCQSLLEIKDLSCHRGRKAIFTNLSLSVRASSITAIMGPSGVGKTTLLHLIMGALKPTAGSVSLDGTNISQLNKKQLYDIRHRMGILFQQGGLFTDYNVFDNVAFPLRQHTQLSEATITDLVVMMLHAVGLRGAAQLPIRQLSGGMAHRVALARSIILSPDLMLYDEPFSGQDPIGRAVLLRLIKSLNQALGLTSILVSHDVAEVISIADYIFLISKEGVLAQGTPEQLTQSDAPDVVQFMQGLSEGPVAYQYPAKPYAEDLRLG